MPNIKAQIATRLASDESMLVWVPTDFVALGSRDAIDKALQRMASAGELERLDRGLYVKPGASPFGMPDYLAVVEAIARPDRMRFVVDGEMAAWDLGLTATLPAKVIILAEARRRPLKLGNLRIEFKQTTPGRLVWAGRLAMRVVQALHWLKESQFVDRRATMDRLKDIVSDPIRGPLIRRDLIEGFSALPGWMQSIVRELPGCDPAVALQDVRYAESESRPAKSKRGRTSQVQMVR